MWNIFFTHLSSKFNVIGNFYVQIHHRKIKKCTKSSQINFYRSIFPFHTILFHLFSKISELFIRIIATKSFKKHPILSIRHYDPRIQKFPLLKINRKIELCKFLQEQLSVENQQNTCSIRTSVNSIKKSYRNREHLRRTSTQRNVPSEYPVTGIETEMHR